jgi:hypothetical protein
MGKLLGVQYKGSYYLDKLAQGITMETLAEEHNITPHGMYLAIHSVLKKSGLKFNDKSANVDVLKEYQNTRLRQTQEINELKRKNKHLHHLLDQNHLEDKASLIVTLEQKNKKLQEDIDYLENRLNNVQEPLEMDKLRKELANLRIEMSGLREENHTLKAKLSILNNKKELDQQIQNLPITPIVESLPQGNCTLVNRLLDIVEKAVDKI